MTRKLRPPRTLRRHTGRRAIHRRHKLRLRTLLIRLVLRIVRLSVLPINRTLRLLRCLVSIELLLRLGNGVALLSLRDHGDDITAFGVAVRGAVFLAPQILAVLVKDEAGIGGGGDEKEPAGKISGV